VSQEAFDKMIEHLQAEVQKSTEMMKHLIKAQRFVSNKDISVEQSELTDEEKVKRLE